MAGFGLATIVFGLTGIEINSVLGPAASFVIAVAALFLTGAFDNISVVVRHTLVQVLLAGLDARAGLGGEQRLHRGVQ